MKSFDNKPFQCFPNSTTSLLLYVVDSVWGSVEKWSYISCLTLLGCVPGSIGNLIMALEKRNCFYNLKQFHREESSLKRKKMSFSYINSNCQISERLTLSRISIYLFSFSYFKHYFCHFSPAWFLSLSISVEFCADKISCFLWNN